MTLRTARLLRVLTLLGLAGVVLAGVRLLDAPPPEQTPEPRPGELSVQEGIWQGGRRLAIRGYVFEGPGGLALRLCNARRRGDPPSCIGPFVELDGADAGTFNLEEGRADGLVVRWSPDPLTLVGPLDGVRLNVQQVLR